LTQAERGGTPERLRRSHPENINRRRILSSLLPVPTDFIRWPIGPSMNIGAFCYPLEKKVVPENTTRQAAGAEQPFQLFVFNNLSCVIWNRFGSGFFDKSILKSETSV
jgi:hypothetical protein